MSQKFCIFGRLLRNLLLLARCFCSSAAKRSVTFEAEAMSPQRYTLSLKSAPTWKTPSYSQQYYKKQLQLRRSVLLLQHQQQHPPTFSCFCAESHICLFTLRSSPLIDRPVVKLPPPKTYNIQLTTQTPSFVVFVVGCTNLKTCGQKTSQEENCFEKSFWSKFILLYFRKTQCGTSI